MTVQEMNAIVQRLKPLIMSPVVFQDVSVELLDIKSVNHDKRWECPEHHHPWFEFNYVHDGELFTTMNNTEFSVKSGQSFLIPPGCSHSHTHHKKNHDIGICLRWKIQRAPNKNCYYEKIFSALYTPRAFSFDASLDILCGGTTYVQTQLSFIGWMINMCEMWNKGESTNISVQENYISNQAIMYLQEYYNHPITVQNIATSLNISYRNLSRNFKKETGITIIEKLNEIRIAEAKRLLISTNLPIYEIALMVGFENEYYFSNTFHQYAASTPSGFRKNNRL
ncbi:MAG: AraC family transcriptional regulator [Bacillota bacterium]|nr:AraC family transcriptional regulator [Bacillota bacterium]